MALHTQAAGARKPPQRGPFADLSLPLELTVRADGADQVVELTAKLGQGGQGAVFATQNRNVVLKLCAASGDEQARSLVRRFERLQCLGLEDLPIALPEAVVEAPTLTAVGYLAPWLEDMISLQHWLAWPSGDGEIDVWYGQTGGLRRRLRALAKVARMLAALHARGASYGDVSPGNVFVSESLDHEQVWLIDADNIAYVVEADGAVYTPRYGAPEIVRGQNTATLAADVFSFGLMAFEILTLCHPLIGDEVNDGEPELEEAALCGEVPWIDDPDDDVNATNLGYPRTILLTNRLRRVAEATFGAGRLEPRARPSMATWADALSRAADGCATCTEARCGHSFRVALPACPFCDAPLRDDMTRVDLQLWRQGDALRAAGCVGASLRSWVFAADAPLHLPRSALLGRREWLAQEPALTLTRTARGVRVSGDLGVGGGGDQTTIVVASPGSTDPKGDSQRLGRGRVIDRGWRVHLDPEREVHRVLVVSFEKAK